MNEESPQAVGPGGFSGLVVSDNVYQLVTLEEKGLLPAGHVD